MNELIVHEDGSLRSVDDAYISIRHVENAIESLKKEEEERRARRKALESRVDEAKAFIKRYMLQEGLAELEGNVVKYSLAKSQPKLVIEDEKAIPEDYKLQTVITEIRKDAIKDQLKMGDQIPGCRLEDSFSLKVGVK